MKASVAPNLLFQSLVGGGGGNRVWSGPPIMHACINNSHACIYDSMLDKFFSIMILSAPMDVMAQLKNDDSISATITWKMPKDMQNADQCYEVFYLSEEGIENSKEARGSECSLKNLEPDKTYTITVGILKKPIRSRSIKITTKQHCTLWLHCCPKDI